MRNYFDQHSFETPLSLPIQQTILCEGLPGVGKSWVIKTLRNITRPLHGTDSDMATTPTGCSAFLIDGSTHYRKHSIPAGTKIFNKPPCNVLSTVSNKIRAIRASTAKVISRFMDEHSMSGRQMWAWLKHRHEEFRRPGEPVLDKNDDVIESTENNSPLYPNMYNRMWGGIPFIYSFGDSHQLPPVSMKPFFSKDAGKHCSSCSAGKMAYNKFIHPNADETKNTVFILDDVIRQDKESQAPLLNALDHMRKGDVSREDAKLLFS